MVRGRKGNVTVDQLAAKFENFPNEEGSVYDQSLLVEMCRVAARCHLKNRFVQGAVVLTLLAIACGTAALMLHLWA